MRYLTIVFADVANKKYRDTMTKDTRKKLINTVVIAIIHFAIKDIFKDFVILQKMYFPAQIWHFFKYISYEYGFMIGRCTGLQIKCNVFLVLAAVFLSFIIYYLIVWVMSHIINR